LFVFLLAGTLCGSSLLAQEPRALVAHHPISPKVEHPFPLPPAVPGSMIGGPWIVDRNYKSTVYIKNGVETSAVTVTPDLYLSNGVRYTLPDIQLEPAGTAVLDIGSSLQKLGIAPYATLNGYIELRYNFPWDPICATIRNLDATHSVVFSYGFRSSKPPQLPNQAVPAARPDGANVIDGMWWKQEANVTGFVALANTTTQTLNVNLDVSDDTGVRISQHTATISPHGAKILNLHELLSAKSSDGGIRITYTGRPTDLIVNGGLEDIGSGYSANIPFNPAPALATASTFTVAELGLMTGRADPMMHFPAGIIFTPYTVLRNVSNGPIEAAPTVWWMDGGSPRSSLLPAIRVSPNQSKTLDVAALFAAAGLKDFSGNVQLVFKVQGNAGGLLLAGGSVDKANNYVFQVTPHGISESGSKSLSYWHTGDDDTMVTLWNPADEAQDFIFQLTHSSGYYNFPIHLEARATRTFNVSEIAESGIPDAEGNVIPLGVVEGSAKIAGTHGDNENILVAMDAGTYNVRRATCYTYCQGCNGITSSALASNPFAVAVGAKTQQTLYETWNTGSQYDDTSYSSWKTSNSSIATVGTNGSGTPGLVAGVSAGSPTISAQYPYNEAQYTSYWCEGSPWNCPLYYTTVIGSSSGGSCTVKISPSSMTPNNCSGDAVSQNFNGVITPSASACLYSDTGATCSAKDAGGAVEIKSVDCEMSLVPAGTVTYFAGPGTSGKQVGSIQFSFSFKLGSQLQTPALTAPVYCP
jgi:hypothetical protein